ncbi:hypothetical protein MOQ72_27040 [Saccharopolyspora sp. K220]|uniref:hypothetical protein n=1 Tax=Saccharopolyspora soli TaxID=2926618 RepID=UPI001F56CD31|nr:hypothetical protein [Saccharopolyspora soli]MCI2421104.1 hypothetical protein [Saccharopolyspora soli]
MSDAVARELGQEQADLVRSGELVNPEYECMVCRQLGDLRTEQSAAVLLVSDEANMLSWVHARCGDSEVVPLSELEARFGQESDHAPGQTRSNVPDETYTTVVQLAGRIYPALVIRPGDTICAVIPGTPTVTDSAVYAMRELGFGDVDLSGGEFPVQLPEWAVRVDKGRLDRITKPGGTWWASGEKPALDAQWRQAAREQRQALVMVVGVTLPEGDLASLRAGMAAAADEGRLVGALISVRGTMS